MINNKIEYVPDFLALKNVANSGQVDCLSYIDDKFETETPQMRQNVQSLIEQEMRAIKHETPDFDAASKYLRKPPAEFIVSQ